MSENATGANDPTDSDEQAYDSAAAAAIARDRIAEDLDPSEFGAARTLDELLLTFAEEVRTGEVTSARVSDVRTHLRNIDDALDDLAALHGFGNGRGLATLDTYEVSRDDLGTSRIDVSDVARAHVYDEGDDDEVAVRLDALPGDVDTDADTDTVTLTATAARRLRAELGSALEARDAERRRYDEGDE